MNDNFKQGFEKIASAMLTAIVKAAPKAAKATAKLPKITKLKPSKSLGGVFGPGSFK